MGHGHNGHDHLALRAHFPLLSGLRQNVAARAFLLFTDLDTLEISKEPPAGDDPARALMMVDIYVRDLGQLPPYHLVIGASDVSL